MKDPLSEGLYGSRLKLLARSSVKEVEKDIAWCHASWIFRVVAVLTKSDQTNITEVPGSLLTLLHLVEIGRAHV